MNYRTFVKLLFVGAISTAQASDMITIDPPASAAEGTPLALIYIHGMSCEAEAYRIAAEEFQTVAAEQGYKTYVAIPQFIFDAPEPVLIDHYVQDAIKELTEMGFSGENIFMAAHSLGGVMSQKYVKGRTDIKGQILMGSVLLRDNRSIQDDGTTEFDFNVPTLTIGGTKDGLLRISRVVESFWHQETNINEDQADMFPVVAIDGLSHAGFMDNTMLPSFVTSSDLNQEIEQAEGHEQIAEAMIGFVKSIVEDDATAQVKGDTQQLLQPLIWGMNLEGFYNMKPACYASPLLNPDDDDTCLQGSIWSSHAQRIMAGELPQGADKSKVMTTDNFHRVYSTNPVHLPQINNECSLEDAQCDLDSYSVTENIYSTLDTFDTGKSIIAATEMKVKLKSRQAFQVAAGNSTADFHENDEEGNRCGDINQAVIDWAYENASPKAKERYDTVGKKMVIGDDKGPYNAGPLWIWYYLQWDDNEDKTETIVQSPMMRTPTDYFISSAAGFHYCKLISPFRAMEWIYVDSLYDHDGLTSFEQQNISWLDHFKNWTGIQ